MQTTVTKPVLSVVIPFYNEEESLQPVCKEVVEVLNEELPIQWELILVNDGSIDDTACKIDEFCATHPCSRSIHLSRNCGQSAALQAGILAARGDLVGTLDGDGQNDPHDLPLLLKELTERRVDMMCGIRSRRADNIIRRISSRIANQIRAAVLKDNITDVGCSLRVFRKDCFERIPFFRNAHRFFPALFQMAGFSIAEMPVGHRVRNHGTSKYGGGINSRLWVGIADLAGAIWLNRRAINYRIVQQGKE